jgi:sugar/nucleoside kinase (ribokinase family)
MKNVLCVGHSAYDLTFLVEEYPIENRKYSMKLPVECGGGPAANAAYLIAKWGVPCRYAGVVGEDVYGHKIRQELEAVGVDCTWLIKDPEGGTPYSFILANRSNGSRTLFNTKPGTKPLELEWDEWKPDIILLDGHEVEASLQVLNRFKDAISVLDAGSFNERTKRLAQEVDYLVCSEDFCREVTGVDGEDLSAVADQLDRLTNNHCVITLGHRGSVYQSNGGKAYQPSIAVHAVDTTGAGDIFHGAFAYALANAMEMEKAIQIASIAAALSVQKLGARVAIPTVEEVENRYREEKQNVDFRKRVI